MKNSLKNIMVRLNFVKLLSLPLYIFRLFPIKRNRILFENFTGKGFGDSPKYIAEKLLEYGDRYELYWVINKKTKCEFPNQIKAIKLYSIKYFYIMATSKIWISNSRFDQYVVKRKKQFYLQTWHSPLRLKKIEYDAIENLSNYYKKVMKNDSKNIDLMISGCDFSYNIYRNSFGYSGDIKKIGTPRCDLFFNSEKCKIIKEKILDKYGIKKGSKIVLYAPTFRKGKIDMGLFDVEKIFHAIDDNNTILLLRLHPSSKMKFDVNESKIIDVSKYPDIQELICANDMMITDYSSCCFDQMIADKPCILYTPDLETYLKKERNLYFDFSELPFPIVKDYNELKICYNNFDRKKYDKNIKRFKKEINLYENGKATYEIVKIIESVICDNEKI